MKMLKPLKLLWKYLRQDKWKFIAFLILDFVLSATGIVYGIIFGKAVQSLINNNFNNFLYFIMLWTVIGSFSILFVEFIKDYFHNVLEINFLNRISKAVYEKALKLPVKAYDEHKVGEFVNRMYTDPDKIIDLLGRIVRLLGRIVSALFVFVIAAMTSWIIVLEFMILIIFNIICAKVFYPKIKKSQEIISNKSDAFVADTTQNLMGIREIKSLGIRNVINILMNKDIDKLYYEKFRLRKKELIYYLVVSFFSWLWQIAIYITLGYLVYKGHILMAVFIAFEWYIWRIDEVVNQATELGSSYQKVVVAMNRILDILHNRLYDDEQYGEVNLNKSHGNIRFENVSFGYEEDKLILTNFNVNIEAGKKVAIVGKSGMGKSTIFNLLLRFYNPNSGDIFIDNVNIKDLDEESLKKHISIVRQEPYLFNKTIKENFQMLNEKITLNKIRNLCKKTYIDDYIMALPLKYDTLIGEGGINFSGGQKQRLSIARTLEKDSKIILFDEATSALDNESQEYIKKTINDLSKNRTILIIAHRLSTIMDADEILLVNNGQIVAKGSHSKLIKENKLYQKLYNPESMELDI
jgi:ATP-binding cassette, subfamily B, bacterial